MMQQPSWIKELCFIGRALWDLLRHTQHFHHLDHCVLCQHYFVRKVLMTQHASAFVVFPGGFGTLDELFEIINLKQSQKMQDAPIILTGKAYWTPLLNVLNNMFKMYHTASSDALEHTLELTDDLEQIVAIIQPSKVHQQP